MTTTLVSIDPSGSTGADRHVKSAMMAGDATKIVFDADAFNLTADHLLGGSHVFLRDLSTRSTSVVARNVFGEIVVASTPSISRSGSTVAFASDRPGTVSGLSTSNDQLFVRDLAEQDTRLVSRAYGTGGGSVPGSPTPTPVGLSTDGRFAAFAIIANNTVPGIASDDAQIYVRRVDDPPAVERVTGSDRYAAAAANSARLYSPDTHSVVYIASGEGYPDALSASGAAASTPLVGAPVLLVRRDTVPAEVAAEIRRQAPRTVIIIGGPATVSDAVRAELEKISGRPPLRIDGPNRYAVSAATSVFAFRPGVPIAYVASGENFPDALAAGAVAGRGGGPVLLTQRSGLSTEVTAELQRLRPEKIVVLGGTGTIDDSVVASLQTIAPTSRVAGNDRYSTAVEASKAVFPGRTHTVYISSGEVFPDALSASATAATSRGPLLLVQKDSIPTSVAAELTRLEPRTIVVVGGPNTVSDRLVSDLNSYLRAE